MNFYLVLLTVWAIFASVMMVLYMRLSAGWEALVQRQKALIARLETEIAKARIVRDIDRDKAELFNKLAGSFDTEQITASILKTAKEGKVSPE